MSSAPTRLPALLVALAAVIAVVAWIAFGARPSKGDGDARDRDGALFTQREGASTGALASDAPRDGASFTDGGVLRETVHDARVREEMRRKIFEAWANDEAARKAAPVVAAAHVPMPETADGGVDPAYIRERVREDFFPMARECYGAFLDERHDAGRTDVNGSVVMKFTIVGDEKIGGVVEEASLGDAGTLHDEKLATCFRESMMSMAFRPPPHRGQVTVEYPISFSDDDDDDDATSDAGRGVGDAAR